MKLNSIIILQSKIDLVGRVGVEDHREQIKEFIRGEILSELNMFNFFLF
jgi:translation initiation factor 2 gamma subunit (eIF-2gamma)